MSKYPKINIGVGAIVLNNTNEILLIKRKKGKPGWAIPGGYMEKNETIYEAVIREIKEETNIDARVDGLIGLRQRFTNDEGYNIWILALTKYVSGSASPDLKEVTEAVFFNFNEIKKKDLTESTKLILEKLINKDLKLLTVENTISNNNYVMFL